MAEIRFDFNKRIGKIKAMNAVGQPPFEGISDRHFHYLTEANIPFSRLHDVGGMFARSVFVDIPNIFKDFSADENDPASYHFEFTDILIGSLIKAECMPIFRLGVTIENYQHIRTYHIYPPADYDKWSRICEHIIRHYREGWANGFNYDIVYWEIWNEPDFEPDPERNQMWKGTPEEFYRLYETAAKHLKKCFGSDIKIGGYGSCGFYGIFADPEKYGMPVERRDDEWTQNISHIYHIDFFTGFLEHIKKTDTPIDFFSWHTYCSVFDTAYIADYANKTLAEYGYGDIETMMNEWNPTSGKNKLGSSESCSNAAAMMCMMQYKKTDMLCYYDARMFVSAFGGMFNPITEQPFSTYYAFKAFGELLALEHQTESLFSEHGLYVVAASDGQKKAAMIVNISDNDMNITTDLDPDMKAYLIDEAHPYEEISDISVQNFCLKKYGVVVVKNH